MCQGSERGRLCGQPQKCASPPGSMVSLDTDYSDYDQKLMKRTAELMSQLRLEEGATNVKNLVDRGNTVSKSMHENLVQTQNMISCKAPWDPNSDSDSDAGNRDTAHLTPDGTEVIQKEYVLINGHYALITYRKQLKDVDPYLLLKLRQKREKEVAKWEAKQKKGKGRGFEGEQDSKQCISEPLAQLTGIKANTSARRTAAGESRGNLDEGLSHLQEKLREGRVKARASSPFSLPSSSSSSERSFKARAARVGFHPTKSGESIKRQGKDRVVELDDDPDIWLMIADQYRGESITEYKGETKLTRGPALNKQ
ncbi:hypothetical protein F5B22DRAFT_358293 [Xylaria bambusicola]|uniref:uncharacterized protein n=1 Tax=Xylaria bambusicola TaxID=326684 RepID=UPI0020072C8C|nr:uncharacterized protein F5B22DRAFT_358293 [Xylaria bambusicola]KAI0509269.1 hypothetical protein F5B22DRAFT_358293 [Xylaria bambusicola]